MPVNFHRVVVQISEDEMQPEEVNVFSSFIHSPLSPASGSSISTRPMNTTSMKVLDKKTLQLNICHPQSPQTRLPSCKQLRFDCVGTTSNAHTRAEITMLMDDLFLQQNNCVLLRFNALRECQLAFLCNLLVTEVDKRMQMMNAKLQTIKLEYYDVRKYDVVNLLGQFGKHSTTKSKRNFRLCNTFISSLELLKWLQGRYLQLFAIGQGHENMDFQFVFTDARRRVFDLKLSIMSLYMSQMDSDTKLCLRNFLENINNKQKLKHLMITDCLKEFYINGTEKTKWHSWFLFNIPMIKGGGVIVDDMIKLATAAYDGLNVDTEKEEEDLSLNLDLDHILSSSSKYAGGKFSMQHYEKSIPIDTASSDFSIDSSNLSSSIPSSTSSPTHSAALQGSITAKNNLSYTVIDKHKKIMSGLNYWYTKMDDRTNKVIQSMEAYYNCKYSAKIDRICSDIIKMMHPKKSEQIILPNEISQDEELRKLLILYNAAIHQFSRLVKEIEFSPNGDLLKAHFKIKTDELKRNELFFKKEQLQNCQKCLAETIKSEIKCLDRISVAVETPATSKEAFHPIVPQKLETRSEIVTDLR